MCGTTRFRLGDHGRYPAHRLSKHGLNRMIARLMMIASIFTACLFGGCNASVPTGEVASETSTPGQTRHTEANTINVGQSFSTAYDALDSAGAGHRGRFVSDRGAHQSAWVLPGYRVVVFTLSNSDDGAFITAIRLGESGKGDHTQFTSASRLNLDSMFLPQAHNAG